MTIMKISVLKSYHPFKILSSVVEIPQSAVRFANYDHFSKKNLGFIYLFAGYYL